METKYYKWADWRRYNGECNSSKMYGLELIHEKMEEGMKKSTLWTKCMLHYKCTALYSFKLF